MIVGVDGNEANVKQKVGVSVYTLRLLELFQKEADAKLGFKIFLKEALKNFLPKQKDNFQYKVIPAKFMWLKLFLSSYLLFDRSVDVFFSPAHYTPRVFFAPLVVTIHDLSYFYYPEEFLAKDLYKLKKWTEYAVRKAKKVIAVSENTKKDLIKFYDLPKEKIVTIYNGYERQAKNSELKAKNYNLKLKTDNPYILYVGTLQPRKNILLLIRAFNRFQKENSQFKLVIVGKKGWLYDEIFTLTKKLQLEKKVVFLGYVSDEELVYLYKNAFCFVLPSLYEGFGITILEAMSYSCPVITSNSSSLPEVGGEACLYFNPRSETELLEKLKLLKENTNLRQELIKKGKERIKLFSWQKCAEETLEVIKGALV